MTLSEQLRAAREELQWTQQQTSQYSGVCQQTISEIETGHCDPRLSTLMRLVEVYGLILCVRMDQG